MSEPVVTVEAREHVLRVGIQRPAKRNAFNLQVLRELSEAYTRLEDDPELRCLLLFAHGEHFSAGLDLAEVGPHVAAGGGLYGEGGVDPFGLFGRRRRKPVVAAMQGYCYTVSVELALASEVVVAARDARFTQFEVRRGIMPFGGATLRFARVAGYQNAMRYVLTGDFFDAAEAQRMGLVQEVTDAGAQFERALADRGDHRAPGAAGGSGVDGQRADGRGGGPRGGPRGDDGRGAGADGERRRARGADVLRRAARGAVHREVRAASPGGG